MREIGRQRVEATLAHRSTCRSAEQLIELCRILLGRQSIEQGICDSSFLNIVSLPIFPSFPPVLLRHLASGAFTLHFHSSALPFSYRPPKLPSERLAGKGAVAHILTDSYFPRERESSMGLNKAATHTTGSMCEHRIWRGAGIRGEIPALRTGALASAGRY